MIARVRQVMPTVPRISPPSRGDVAPDSWTREPHKFDATTAMKTSGALIKKIDPNQKWTSKSPPTTGPMAIATPLAAPQIPKAFARSLRSSKATVRVESVAGNMNAADAPMSARAINNVGTLCEKAAKERERTKTGQRNLHDSLSTKAIGHATSRKRRPAKGSE